MSGGLTSSGAGLAAGLAFAIPIVASVGPITVALSSTLRDALDSSRTKVTASAMGRSRCEQQQHKCARRLQW